MKTIITREFAPNNSTIRKIATKSSTIREFATKCNAIRKLAAKTSTLRVIALFSILESIIIFLLTNIFEKFIIKIKKIIIFYIRPSFSLRVDEGNNTRYIAVDPVVLLSSAIVSTPRELKESELKLCGSKIYDLIKSSFIFALSRA